MNTQQIQLVLIDDDPGVLRALGLLLRAMQYSVTPFSSPSEALAYLRGRPPVDLVVTDLRMPELSGADVVTEIKGFTGELPVIVMSGHAAPSEVQELRNKGADAFIPKPFTPEQLATAVNHAVGQRRNLVGFA
jgi:CheY-like chemotaxis protein